MSAALPDGEVFYLVALLRFCPGGGGAAAGGPTAASWSASVTLRRSTLPSTSAGGFGRDAVAVPRPFCQGCPAPFDAVDVGEPPSA